MLRRNFLTQVCLWLVPVAMIGFLSLGIGLDLVASTVPKKHQLTILYTTDLYGNLRDFRCHRPGVKGYTHEPAKRDISNLLYQVNKVQEDVVQRKRMAPPLLFNTGDNLATELATRFLLEFEGLAGVDFAADVFDRFGYDLIGLGNHEFSVPPEKLRDFLKQARFRGLKFSAANLEKAPEDHSLSMYVNRDGLQKTKYFVFERGGLKIGVFHLVPNELQNKVSRKAVKGVEFNDPESVASDLVTKLREEAKVDLVIVLSHLESSSGTVGANVRQLARSTKGIDLIITNELRDKGNTTAISNFDLAGKGVYIVGGAKFGNMLGRVDLQVEKTASGAKIASFRVDSIPLKDNEYDLELRRELTKWELTYCKRWGKPIGEGMIRSPEGMTHNQFMDYLLNLIRKQTRTEVAFLNVGAVRKGPFPLKGYITKDDLYRALPFDNRIVLLPVKGSTLTSLLEYSDTSNTTDKALHFVGAKDGKINSRAVEDSGTYWVATIDYVASPKGGWLNVDKKYHIPLKYENGKRPTLREYLIHHLSSDDFKKISKMAMPPKPKEPEDEEEKKKAKKLPPPKPFQGNELAFNGEFGSLADHLAWKFNSEAELAFTSIFVNPINISSFYSQKDTLSGSFFRKYQLNGTITLKMQAETRMHLWITTFTASYDADVSDQFVNGPPVSSNFIFQENTDRLELKTEYRFRYFETLFPGQSKWYFTSPFVEALLESEISPGGRGFLSDEDFFRPGDQNERFHHFEVRGKAGLSFKFTEHLTFRLGAAGRREFALGYRQSAIAANRARVVRTEFNLGLSVDYELQSWEIAKIGTFPVSWESKGEFLLTVLLFDPVKKGEIFDFAWTNKISFAFSSYVSLALGLKFYMYRGLFPKDTSNENSVLVAGPLAFRLEPTVALRFNFGRRGQAF